MDIDITNIQSTLTAIRWDKKKQREIKNLTGFLKNANMSERVFCIVNNLTATPTCKGCQNPVKFGGFKKGYNLYCGGECRNACSDVKDKRRLTNMNRYGGASPMNSDEVKEKSKTTMDIVYGVENPSQLGDVKEKKKATLRANYGVENPSQSDEIQQRKRKTYQRKYGKDHWTQDKKKNDAFVKKLAEGRMLCSMVADGQWICKTCEYPFHSVEKDPGCPVCSQITK